MKHKMGLYKGPFQSIQSGKKVFEVRLYDKKRQNIQKDDKIEFTNLTTKETICAKVTELKCYQTFQQMYEDIDKELLDCANWSVEEMLASTYEIYTKEQEKRWGTIAIGVEVIA
ncbi:ASCH domain-containing protein [Bacillus pseudomycoides]|uniref:ASCH domain-containing protein n=1 Tax=Bacillus pseudomycoides TaxID=64104 RepID=UPI000BEC9A64|nr:ASCH domain-containing protein [Bacillus pseudomycoides]PEB43743.1 ASCH domain-containing protein [Bacillus pseudomycoides]PGD83959.1 ASCH domain-containing protein [Bacillus pseudomycoides]PGD97575.1 ASCH domain-containing protein [Bacillus pseudomycoides]PHE67854.1 ASCH domain-containing protein [Bacillus pseudomycoides]PHG14745.1 ASCH domain-containing protein [Bacillus pseudomycoides]